MGVPNGAMTGNMGVQDINVALLIGNLQVHDI